MDPLTHAISGVALARAFPKLRLPPKQVALLVLLTMAPDIDVLLRLWSDDVYLHYHRGLTHSLLMLPLWGWLILALCSKRFAALATLPVYLIGLALLMHIGLDVITTFGTMILAPLSDWRASLDLVFIIDPLFSASLLLPLLCSLIWKQDARSWGMLSLAMMCGYLGLAYHNQQQAIQLIKMAHPKAVTYHALPMAFSPFHWQLIAQYPDSYARAAVNLRPEFSGTRHLFDKAFVSRLISNRMSSRDHIDWQTLPAMHSLKHWERVPGTAFYQWFARFPVLLKESDSMIEFGDLAYGGGVEGVDASFRLQVDKPSTASVKPPKAWLIWRGNRKTAITD